MAKLSDDEASLLEKLKAKLDAPDEDDFEVEIGAGDNFARVPYTKAREWLGKTFGIDLGDPPAEGDDDEGKAKGKAKPKADEGEGGEVRRFGRRVG